MDVVLRGLVECLDDSRPYARQSPCSLTDIGNDGTSGESHAGSFEACLTVGVEHYREKVAESLVPFVSECAIMGAGPLEALERIFPQDKLWDMNEYWDDRLMDNPYSAVLMAFSQRQKYYAESLYGKCNGIKDFICKSMTVHAEAMRAEIEFARFNKSKCGGFMNWMYSDIWPSATWSVVDYYCEPKQVYYQMKKSYAPVLLTFVQTKEGTFLALINDGCEPVKGEFVYGMKSLSGKVLWQENTVLDACENGVGSKRLTNKIKEKNAYLFAEGGIDGKRYETVYSADMWRDCDFSGEYSYSVRRDGEILAVTVKANKFAKGVTLRLPDNFRYEYSDNYFDLQAGEEKTVYINGGAAEKDLTVTDFSKETAHV